MLPFAISNGMNAARPEMQGMASRDMQAQALQAFLKAAQQPAPQMRPAMSGGEGIGLGIAAILAKLLGAPDQEIGAFGQGFLGARGQQRQNEYQSQMSEYERAQQMAKMQYGMEADNAEALKRDADYYRDRRDDRADERLDWQRRSQLQDQKDAAMTARARSAQEWAMLKQGYSLFMKSRDAGESVQAQRKIIDDFGLLGLSASEEQNLIAQLTQAKIEGTRAATANTNARSKGIHIDNEWKPRLNQSRLDNTNSQIKDRTVRQGISQQQAATSRYSAETGRMNAETGAFRAGTAASSQDMKAEAKKADIHLKEIDRQLAVQRSRLREKNIDYSLKKRLEQDIQRLESARRKLVESYPSPKAKPSHAQRPN